ncbi:MAG: DUF3858 domain-containing protein, partial [Candidatus Latescibacteria bacterium]|nr:DUF3858 domain-containing protein [bacterium]MBD3424015.1 DUF3858 domain-containing protein [Candidatus Latescibacterota bacterium]
RIDNRSSYAPFVTWSTASDWKSFSELVSSRFKEAAVISGALADTVSVITEFQPSEAAVAGAVIDFINRNTRGIHYHPGFWFPEPRSAERVWETAYGHSLDRAVLGAAMLREAGLGAELIFISKNTAASVSAPAQVSSFDRVLLRITAGGILGFYDPVSGEFIKGLSHLYGKAIWAPESARQPSIFQDPEGEQSRSAYRITLELTPSPSGPWEGTGYIDAGGIFSCYQEMSGPGGRASSFINRIISSLLPGAEGCQFNPELFTREQVSARFSFSISPEPEEKDGKVRIELGDKPAGGLLEKLPASLQLCHNARTSPVILPAEMIQVVRLRINTGDLEAGHLPRNREITNSAGAFILSAERGNGAVTIRRELRLKQTRVPAPEWPGLRELLLEESDISGRTVILE